RSKASRRFLARVVFRPRWPIRGDLTLICILIDHPSETLPINSGESRDRANLMVGLGSIGARFNGAAGGYAAEYRLLM
ncbi:MAG: hypothetical protein ACO2ZD_09225, partial [Pseudomonadales bacterium]